MYRVLISLMSLFFVFACSSSRQTASSRSSIEKTTAYIAAVDNYFENAVPHIPDSIIHAIDIELPKVENDTALMKLLTRHIFNKYLRFIDGSSDTKIIGIENVIVHIIDNYYLAGRANIDNKKFLAEIIDYANKNRETLIGKQAKNLKMETVNEGAESLYDIDSPYILVCFFDVSCFHCRKEIPQIYKIFKKFKNKGLAGFCVYTRDDKQEWMEFIIKHKLTDWINAWDPMNNNNFRIAYSIYSVPQVYVLDKDMKIVGRGLESEYLEQFLDNLIK